MFVRFRETARRLQVSLVETGRTGGKVRHSHVASLGSIVRGPSVAERVAFWAALYQRLGRLANRVNGEAYGAILAAVHARIPIPTQEEQRAAAVESAQDEVRFWGFISDHNADRIED
jgi:hypothetical protein